MTKLILLKLLAIRHHIYLIMIPFNKYLSLFSIIQINLLKWNSLKSFNFNSHLMALCFKRKYLILNFKENL